MWVIGTPAGFACPRRIYRSGWIIAPITLHLFICLLAVMIDFLRCWTAGAPNCIVGNMVSLQHMRKENTHGYFNRFIKYLEITWLRSSNPPFTALEY
jgi:hypothetical protein